MIRIRLLQNTVFFVERTTIDSVSGQRAKTQRQWHVKRGDIHAVDSVNAVSDTQYQFILPGGPTVSEVVNNVDRGTVEIIKDVPQAKSSPGCGGCGGK